MADSEAVATLRKTLEQHLSETFGGYQVDSVGDYRVPYESSVTWIRPGDWADGQTVVRVWSITNVNMDVTPELTRYLATENGNVLFGGFALDEDRPSVIFKHTLLGDFLQRKELEVAVAAVASTANVYDDQIKQRFGGLLFSES